MYIDSNLFKEVEVNQENYNWETEPGGLRSIIIGA